MNNLRVILADINTSYTAWVSDYLKFRGDIDVVGVYTSGSKLVESYSELKPDVIVMNLILTDMDGICALDKLRSMSGTVPIIICTEFCNEITIASAQRHGASGYLCKPVILSSLHDIILEYGISCNHGLYEMPESSTSVDTFLMDRLAYLGISASCTGYSLIISAVKSLHNEPSMINAINKTLYPDLARKYNSTVYRVERNIRNAIKSAHMRGMMDGRERVPTNKQLIVELTRELEDVCK